MLLTAVSAPGATENEIPAVSQVPLAAMQALRPLAGRWQMTVYLATDSGDGWSATPPQTVDIGFGHKGFMLVETPADLSGPGFHMQTYITYDQYRHVYRKAALDDVWGVLDLYEGRLQRDAEGHGRLVMTNLAAGTLFPVDDATWRGFRLTIEIRDVERWMWIDKTDDDGASWQPAFKVEYRAAGSESSPAPDRG